MSPTPRLALAILLTFLSAPLVTSALADSPMPYAKPGLWTLKTTSDGHALPMSTLICIDSKTQKNLFTAGESTMASLCSVHEAKTVGHTIVSHSVCKIGNSTLTSSGTITVSGDSTFQNHTSGTFSPAFMGKTKTNAVQDGRWTGPCEPGMSPGDMFGVDAHGRRMKLGHVTADGVSTSR